MNRAASAIGALLGVWALIFVAGFVSGFVGGGVWYGLAAVPAVLRGLLS